MTPHNKKRLYIHTAIVNRSIFCKISYKVSLLYLKSTLFHQFSSTKNVHIYVDILVHKESKEKIFHCIPFQTYTKLEIQIIETDTKKRLVYTRFYYETKNKQIKMTRIRRILKIDIT